MKIIPFVLLCSFILSACSPQPDAIIRVDCGELNNKGLQASVNKNTVGECPVDLAVHSGNIEVSARKDNEDASYLFAEEKITLAANAMKRIKLDIQPVYTEEYQYYWYEGLFGKAA